MKRLLKNWGMLFFALSVMAGCSEENATYSGPDYVMFSDTLQTIAVQSDDTYYDIPVTATTACDYDRTYSVEVVDKGSNAIEGVHYDLQSNNVTIKAGERTSSIKIRGHYNNFEDTDSIGVMLRLTADKDKIWDLYGRDTKVVLVKVCPFDINTFVGYAVLTSTFFTDYMQTTEMRLLTTEKDPEVENGIILKNFLYDGYDIKVSFNTDNPLQPLLEMEPQVVGSTVEAFQGSWHGDDKLRVMNATGAISYYNVCQNFFFQYMTFYVNGVGTVGTYANVVEWISKEEYDYLKKQGY
ncbi:DUF4984 domain-containing protein [Phocaeicola fibrisolvens]|uniref:DUF4984 domain-containing protein n=1 Tax=Phocaeicola fibrisolvens TaxID=2981793 RepID=UPI000821F4F0|nr:DUF4984 domain-containing protein [Phocaeicola fibrisolvens]MCU6778534.1 DUF4984 domain-containing protein [Phocaeicola fibrisolvens]SCH95073.1 Uncharacterised protein [uncultured Bacteroides sp.]